MTPEQPLNPSPFLTLITPTFQRPTQLRACMASIAAQTAVAEVQHIITPDYVRYGVSAGLFGRLPVIAPAVIGQYVNLLCDDDVLAETNVVAQVRAFAVKHNSPDVIVTQVQKGPWRFPICDPVGEPVQGHVDLTSFIVRADVWQAHVSDYLTGRYESDFDHALAMFKAGRRFMACPVLWAIGKQSNGRPETAAA